MRSIFGGHRCPVGRRRTERRPTAPNPLLTLDFLPVQTQNLFSCDCGLHAMIIIYEVTGILVGKRFPRDQLISLPVG